jgi:hypothetical protein
MNKDDKLIGVQRPQWLSCPEAVDFVAATTSAKSARELLNVCIVLLGFLQPFKLTLASTSSLINMGARTANGTRVPC